MKMINAEKWNKDVESLAKIDLNSEEFFLPVLYYGYQKTSRDNKLILLESLSSFKRTLIYDLELWEKDQIDVSGFENFLELIGGSEKMELVQDFACSEQFLLYLKARFTISSFSLEEPTYPDHDHFVLTEDSGFIFVFDEEFKQAAELKFMLKSFYAFHGVEKAIGLLLGIIYENYMPYEEYHYNLKKNRLASHGFIDYYDSFSVFRTYKTKESLNKFIEKKVLNLEKKTFESLSDSKYFEKKPSDFIHEYMSQISSDERYGFLSRSFNQLIMAMISKEGALKDEEFKFDHFLALANKTVLIGILKVEEFLGHRFLNIFSFFDFQDIYNIGKSDLDIKTRSFHSKFGESGRVKEDQAFLGPLLSVWIDGSLSHDIPKFSPQWTTHAVSIESASDYDFWKKQGALIDLLVPYGRKLEFTFKKIERSSFKSLNMNYDDVDFEVLLSTAFIRGFLETVGSPGSYFSLSYKELTLFIEKVSDEKKRADIQKIDSPVWAIAFQKFEKRFELNHSLFRHYLWSVINYHLSGYRWDEIKEEERKFIGGVILSK